MASGLGSGSKKAIEPALRVRLQGIGQTGAGGTARLQCRCKFLLLYPEVAAVSVVAAKHHFITSEPTNGVIKNFL